MDTLVSTRTPAFKELVKELEQTLSALNIVNDTVQPHIAGNRYLTSEEVRLAYNLSPRCLQKYRDTGVIPFVQIGRKILYPQDEIEKILQRHHAQ